MAQDMLIVDTDERGIYGVEAQYDDIMTGIPGEEKFESSRFGSISVADWKVSPRLTYRICSVRASIPARRRSFISTAATAHPAVPCHPASTGWHSAIRTSSR